MVAATLPAMNAEQIREMLHERLRDMNLAALSRGAGRNHAYFQQYLERGTPRVLPEDIRDYLAPILGLQPNELKPSAGSQPLLESNVKPAPGVRPIAWADLPKDVPVYGTVVGGASGEFELNGEVIDYVRRPPGIAKTRGVFALYVVGDSMAPWRQPGDLVYCTTLRQARGGDYVVVALKRPADGGPAPAYLKRLVGVRGPSTILEQYNPPLDDLAIKSDDIEIIYRVLDWPELLGI